ncbi:MULTISPECIES: NAD(P)-dependent oxidoreductase [Polaromonas]|uniref:NAD(P)-dependent oxidoreductase n=1 Tax=Polaromonas aquatica TaxID=332657 RepID=A0ABW1U6W2_9BURK
MHAEMENPTVFVCRDHAVDPLLDEIADNLRSANVEVIRGPHSTPGSVLEYEPATFNALFGRAHVAMFSSRSRCSRAVLEASGQLRGIVNPTIGTETIDIAAANELGILIGHGAVRENYESMAEATVMLVLALMYQLHSVENILKGVKVKPPPGAEGALARMIKGSTVGIIGFGKIGQAVAKRLNAFGARVLANSRSLTAGTQGEGATAVSLETLLRESDVVIVAVAINSTSRKLIDKTAISLMKAGAYIVNIARGDAVDEIALIDALQSGRIGGAALDTFEVEPLPQSSPLRKMSNVILTPHMIGHSREVYEALVPAAMENIWRLLAGELPLYLRNPEGIEAFRQRVSRLKQAVEMR